MPPPSRRKPLQLQLLIPILLLLAPPAAAQPPSPSLPGAFTSRSACLAAYEECLGAYPGCVAAAGDNEFARLACEAHTQDVCEDQIHANCDKPPTSSFNGAPAATGTKSMVSIASTMSVTIPLPAASVSTVELLLTIDEGSLVVVELTLLQTVRPAPAVQSTGVRVVSRGWMWAAVAAVITTSHSACLCIIE